MIDEKQVQINFAIAELSAKMLNLSDDHTQASFER